MPKKTAMSAKKLGVYRRNWYPRAKKRWIGTTESIVVPPTINRRVQAQII